MTDILEKLALCIEFGKININSPFPPDMRGQEGADELTRKALDEGIKPEVILRDALVVGMDKVGAKFSEKKIFIPQMLMAANAMKAATEHLKPYFQRGEVKRKGKVIIATVEGDLHDIGKNLVKMAIEGAGWEVIDLGVDVSVAKILASIDENPDAVIGLSALLTTTMANMQIAVEELKKQRPKNKILIGGAPVSDGFKTRIGADFYSPDPQGAVKYLNEVVYHA
jgi:5-methyltetrahydrofolate--homocysteine methyltransferase